MAGGLLAAPAAASADTLTPQFNVTQLNATEDHPLTDVALGNFSDSTGTYTAGDYAGSINWGDGTTTSIPGSDGEITGTNNTAGPWTVSGSHTYPEAGGYLLTVTVTNTTNSASTSWEVPVTVADAGLSLPPGSATEISGAGGSAGSAMQSFEGAIGGSDNGTTAGEQNGGFRHITWDDVALNGSDPGSTTITPNHVVSVATTREQQYGIQLSRGVAVANDGFASVNPSVNFPAFSPPNIFAPFNSNRIQLQIVSPASQSSTTTAAATRGLGVMFMNVWQNPDTSTSIQYFSGTTLLDTAFAPPASGPGQPSFVGVVFQSPAVTQVVITMGTATIFNFDSSAVTSGPPDTPPTGPPSGNDLVAGDDVVLAEPANVQPTIQATAGVPVSGVLASFSDTAANGTAGLYRAVVNWGDGSQTGAAISGSGDTFAVTGSHTFMKQGTFNVSTTITDFAGSTQTGHATIDVAPRSSSTSVSCSPKKVQASTSTTCTATVSDVGTGTSIAPTGTVVFSSSAAGATFPKANTCQLKTTKVAGRSHCSLKFEPTEYPPHKARVFAAYQGDTAHKSSTGKRKVTVRPPGCSVKLASKRLARSATRVPIVVTCHLNAVLQITVLATMNGGSRVTFARLKTSVQQNKRTKIRTRITSQGLRALRTGPTSQRITLKVTIVATLRSKAVKVHVTTKGVKVS